MTLNQADREWIREMLEEARGRGILLRNDPRAELRERLIVAAVEGLSEGYILRDEWKPKDVAEAAVAIAIADAAPDGRSGCGRRGVNQDDGLREARDLGGGCCGRGASTSAASFLIAAA